MNGIIYYNRGTKCLVRMCVSLFTLRRSGYAGEAALLYEGDLPPWVLRVMADLNAKAIQIPPGLDALVAKTSLWRYSPFDLTLYIDTDTVVMQDPSCLFPEIERHGFIVTQFTDWQSSGGRISRRIQQFRDVPDDWTKAAIAYGPAINTGVFGFKKDSPFLPEWERITQQAYLSPNRPPGRTIDEIGCQVMLPQQPCKVIDQKWNRSVTYSKTEPGIIHFHGGKHLLTSQPICDEWRRAYWQFRNTSSAYSDLSSAWGDKNLTRLLNTSLVRPDLTICCAADPAYAGKLFKHFQTWMDFPGLREQRYIIFTVNSPATAKEYEPFLKYRNVKLVSFKFPGVTPREAAFSAFVFATAQHVETPYWMKLDGDTDIRRDLGGFIWPNYTANTITADPWHYTRVKGDPGATKHWLNTLDDWWGESPVFPLIDAKARHRHRRCRSYCWIEKTSFTKELAIRCGKRLPVPSHDTTSWYAAMRLELPIERYGFRRYVVA